MASGIGIALALALLLGLLAALWWSWRHPFVGLGLIVLVVRWIARPESGTAIEGPPADGES